MEQRDQVGLEMFGRLLMERARDWTIMDLDSILDGRMRGDDVAQFRQDPPLFNAEQMQILRWLVVKAVDQTLHQVLWALEQTEWVDIAVHTPEGIVESLREVSEGLAVEGVGWTLAYSKQRHNYGD